MSEEVKKDAVEKKDMVFFVESDRAVKDDGNVVFVIANNGLVVTAERAQAEEWRKNSINKPIENKEAAVEKKEDK